MSSHRLVVHRSRCVGNGQCVIEAPEVFDQNDDGTVKVIEIVPADRDDVRRAVAECPSGALTLETVHDGDATR